MVVTQIILHPYILKLQLTDEARSVGINNSNISNYHFQWPRITLLITFCQRSIAINLSHISGQCENNQVMWQTGPGSNTHRTQPTCSTVISKSRLLQRQLLNVFACIPTYPRHICFCLGLQTMDTCSQVGTAVLVWRSDPGIHIKSRIFHTNPFFLSFWIRTTHFRRSRDRKFCFWK